MKGWLLDTNVAEELRKAEGARAVKEWARAQPEQRVFLSILTFGEYTKGINKLADNNSKRRHYTNARDTLLARWTGRVLPVSDEVVLRWGAISGKIRRDTGHPPPVIDTLFAATAIEHGLYLATRNVRDVRLSGAAVFNPWKDDPADFPLAP